MANPLNVARGLHLNFVRAILQRSNENTDFEVAKEEWEHTGLVVPIHELKDLSDVAVKYMYGVDEFKEIDHNGMGECICSNKICNHCMIRNTQTEYKLFIGCDCVKHFDTNTLNGEFVKILKSVVNDIQYFKKMFDDDTMAFKVPSQDTINYAVRFNHITRSDAWFLEMLNRNYKKKDFINLDIDDLTETVRLCLKMLDGICKQSKYIKNTEAVIKRLVFNNSNVSLIRELYEKYIEKCPFEEVCCGFYFDKTLRQGVYYPNINECGGNEYKLRGIEVMKGRNIIKLIWRKRDIHECALCDKEIEFGKLCRDCYNRNNKKTWVNDFRYGMAYLSEYTCSKCARVKTYDIKKYAISSLLPPVCHKCATKQRCITDFFTRRME